MNNWRRDTNDSTHWWNCRDNDGAAHFVTCDENGWIDRNQDLKAPTDCELIYCWSDGRIEIDSGFDLSEPGTSGMGMTCIVAWQPVPQPFTKENT